MTTQTKNKIQEFKERFSNLLEFVDLDGMKKELGDLEMKSMKTDFWEDNERAQKIMQRIGDLQNEIEILENTKLRLVAVEEIADLEDDSMDKEIEKEIRDLEKQINKLELKKYLDGKYDKYDAILSIHAGQGGTEAMDWTAMLLRMYLRYAESQGWKAEIIEEVRGQEAGYSSVTIEITGNYAFGFLKKEHGTHRLVRISPFNAQGQRQTSFAGIEVVPAIDDDIDIELNDDNLEFSAVRSGGKGGQNVNKVSTSVRLKHIPTGISVSCSSERSQLQNRKNARKLLRGKLLQMKMEKQERELNKVTGEHKVAGWGNQIRNYVLQPYKLVKDLRTGVESTNPDDILDGKLDEFIEAEIRL